MMMCGAAGLLVWGANSHGQLHLGDTEDRHDPCDITLEGIVPHGGVVCGAGGGHTVLVGSGGRSLLACGWNHRGQVGLKYPTGNKPAHEDSVTTLVDIPLHLKPYDHVKEVACGWDFTLILLNSGQVYACGSNEYGQCGFGEGVKSCHVLQRIVSLENEQCSHVACGMRHTVVTTGQMLLFGFGANKYGQLGLQVTKDDMCVNVFEPRNIFHDTIPRATQLKCDDGDVQIACGGFFTVLVTFHERVYCWGRNERGQCGVEPGDSKVVRQPRRLNLERLYSDVGDSSLRIHHVCCGQSHAVMLVEWSAVGGAVVSSVYSWGRNDYGQLGRATSAGHCHHPGRVALPLHHPPLCHIGCGAEHCVAVSDGHGDSHDVFTWGWNEHGMCGDGSTVNRTMPARVSYRTDIGVNSHHRILTVACGYGHNVCIYEHVTS